MKNQYITILAVALFSAFTFTSCDKDDDETKCTNPEDNTKSVMLEFEFEMADAPFEYNTVYDFNGVNVQFSDLRFYVSDIMLHDDAANMEMIDGAVLVDAGASSNIFTIGETEFEHVHELHMSIGLNEVVNHEDPILAEAPLNDASMHWGWDPASGYKFIKTEVLVDLDDDGIPETATSIHCATDGLKRDVMLDAHQDVEGDHAHLLLKADIADIYAGVDFLNLTGTFGNTDLTNAVADNLADAIEIE